MVIKPKANGRFYINPVEMVSYAYAWEHGTLEDCIETLLFYMEQQPSPSDRAMIVGLRKAIREKSEVKGEDQSQYAGRRESLHKAENSANVLRSG